MPFNPREQERLASYKFDPLELVTGAINDGPPWEGIVDFVTHPSFCGFPIFPRQATLLKLIFLETEQMTQYDVDVIEEWRHGFVNARDRFGVQPDIWNRVKYLQDRGYRRFPWVQMVVGRRGSKGLVGAALGCEQVAYLHSLDCPQKVFGLPEDKDVFMNVGATNQTTASRQLFADIRNMIERCKYFRPEGKPPWLAELKDNIFRVRTPADLRKIAEMRLAKMPIDHQVATLVGVALGASSVSGRGSTSFCNAYDEFSFHVQTGSVKSDSQIYSAWQPNLGQFSKEALTYIPSSPWTKAGQFYVLYQQAVMLMESYSDNAGVGEEARQNLLNVGQTVELTADPARLVFQGPSWALYSDWARTPQILGLGYTFPKAPEPDLTDERQQREQRMNPDTFRVEKLGQFREVLDAYLDPDAVDRMFIPPDWREPLRRQDHGIFSREYRIHCDPGRTGANFALAIGHLEDAPPDEHGMVWPHVVFDLLKVWRPMDFPEDSETHKRTIDYVQVHQEIEAYLRAFASTTKISFDQWQQAYFLSALKREFHPTIKVTTINFTEKENQARCEAFKTILNLGWLHAYRENFYTDDLSCLLELELKFLSEKLGKVVKQETGPVVTKDLADCFDDQTEVLTESGWKLFAKVHLDEKVATRSAEGLLEYQVPTDQVARRHRGKLYTVDSGKFNFAVTPGHRLLGNHNPSETQRFLSAEEVASRRAAWHVPRLARIADRPSSVMSFDRVAGIYRVDRAKGSRKKTWTPDQESYLVAHYATASMDDLCVTLGRSRWSVYAHAAQLNLVRGQIGERLRGNGPCLPNTKTADFARFLGFWLAEGQKMRDKLGNSIIVTQTKLDGILWADAMFSRLGWPVHRSIQSNGETAWTVRSKELKAWLVQCQGDGHELLIPDEVFRDWNREEMGNLLEGLMVGDGTWHAQNGWHFRYNTNSYRLASDVQRLLAHLGETSGRVRLLYEAGPAEGSRYKSNEDMWTVDVDHSRFSRLQPDRMVTIDYDGMVYCLTVPNSTLLVRRHGVTMWCGNCVQVVTVDLLKNALDRYKGADIIKGAYGSTDGAGLKSGRELDRMAQGALNPYRKASEVVGINKGDIEKNLRRAAGMTTKRTYEPNRLSSIHSRPQKNTRDRRKGL